MIPNALGQLVEQNWKDIPKHWQHIDILEYRVMPNHIHGVIVIKDYIESGIDMDIVGDSGQDGLTGTINCAPTVKEQREAFGKPTKGTIPTIIKLFKAGVTRQVGTSTMRELYGPIWQRGYYEHVITSEAELKARIEYIRNNPANWDKDDYYRK